MYTSVHCAMTKTHIMSKNVQTFAYWFRYLTKYWMPNGTFIPTTPWFGRYKNLKQIAIWRLLGRVHVHLQCITISTESYVYIHSRLNTFLDLFTDKIVRWRTSNSFYKCILMETSLFIRTIFSNVKIISIKAYTHYNTIQWMCESLSAIMAQNLFEYYSMVVKLGEKHTKIIWMKIFMQT